MKVRREVVSWFAILLLAVNILASGTLPSRPISSFSNGSTELLASAMEICTEHGPVQQSSDLPGGHDDHGLHCVFCLPLMHGGLALPDTVATIEKLVETNGNFAFASEQQQIIPARFRSIAAPRAPPLA